MRAFPLAGLSVVLICSAGFAAEPGAKRAKWYVDEAGCKFVAMYPVDITRPMFTFTGKCVDGFVAGRGEVVLLDGSGNTYRGEFQQGRMVKGVLDMAQGTYEGEMRDNQVHGQGTLTLRAGPIFKGRFEDGRPAGHTGEVTLPGGARYAGALDMQTLSPQGKGILYYGDGAIFVGEFMAGNKHVGTMKHADGTVAQGTFVGGLMQGNGRIEWASGAWYEGEVQATQPQGRGHMERPTGEVYDGDFVNGYYHGKGTVSTARGDSYVGDFVLGKYHGKGEFKYANGDIQSGEWRDDSLHGKCRIVTATGKYEGTCIAGRREGYGHWESSATHRTYDGEFKSDRFDGKGTLRTKTPEGVEVAYEGQFAQGLMEGTGVLTIGGELRLDGAFKADEFVGGEVSGAGRTFEVDGQTGSVLEVLPDGSKKALDELPADLPI